ncbi:MAG: hypothetical protein O3B47_03445 [bacterium]|nr:hypothetical protein [bacterium]
MKKGAREKLVMAGKKHSKIVFLCGQQCDESAEFLQYFAERSFCLGTGWQNVIGVAVGFVIGGRIPVVLMNYDDVIAAIAQIKENICQPNLNVKIFVVGGDDKFDVSVMECLPNMKICESVEEMVESYGPGYLRISKMVLS